MASVTLKHVTKTFEKQTVLDDICLDITEGSFTVLVGPSGCGKSTTLRIIAGLEKETDGEIWIGGQQVNNTAPGDRDIAMVFQSYALYPTMSVYENIEFGLKNRNVPRAERKKLIDEIAEVTGLADYLKRKPATLSGGQRQRVALARAMVKKPKVFLMDEPLSNLDAKLRNQMRQELIMLHKELGTTFIYVTHDQVEAMSMGDQIVLMNGGRIQQAAQPLVVYDQPSNLFTAQFMGTPPMNMFEAMIDASGKEVKIGNHPITKPLPANHLAALHSQRGQRIHIGIRPEKLQMVSHEQAPLSLVSKSDGFDITGIIDTREALGSETIYSVSTLYGRVMVKSYQEELLRVGESVVVYFPYVHCHYFAQNGERIARDAFFSTRADVSGGV
ncbi:ABC transporter ATP-binding protein [Brevibacillus dissolubilis]|uniref:ABC transporter ATP-binding protein n=1 Tax=Brevibacillus dissolubilis TaxID=1844116 RepID=UPI00111631E0|nr:ABC transporter ATP-binding protein [Brevibacillus dissolubilis]